MSKTKHSYVAFYPSIWVQGVVGLPRPAVSAYFDICLYSWSKAKPMPLAHYKLITHDLGDSALGILQMLADAGKVIVEDDAVYCPRAMEEGEKAARLWAAKSKGGSKTKKDFAGEVTPKSDATLKEESSQQSSEVSSKTHRTDKIRLDKTELPSGNSIPSPPLTDDDEDDIDAAARIKAAELRGKQVRAKAQEDLQEAANAWNAMAVKAGLSQVSQMTDRRKERLGARIKEYGIETLVEWIEKIPQSRFLMGYNARKWKANFDWLLQPDSCAGLIEGKHHNEGEGDQGKPSAWRGSR